MSAASGPWRRLRHLPDLFHRSQVHPVLYIKKQQVPMYIHRWKEQKAIRPLGGRSQVYFNLVVNPDVDVESDRFRRALKMAFPGGLMVGIRPLTQAGWTTQTSRVYELAVPSRRHAFTVPECRLYPRPRAWYDMMGPCIEPARSSGDLPALSAGAALAEAVCSDDRGPGQWVPDPDDLDWGEIEGSPEEWARFRGLVGVLAGVDVEEEPSEEAYEKALEEAARARRR